MREPTYGELATELADTIVERQLMEAARDAIHVRHEGLRQLAVDLAKTLAEVAGEFYEFTPLGVHHVLRRAENLGLFEDESDDEPDDESEGIDERDILWRPDEPAMGQETAHNLFVFGG